VFDIDQQKYLAPLERREFVERNGLKHVPVINSDIPTPASVNITLESAEGRSVLNPATEREGLVFKSNGTVSFKAISNKFLLRQG